MGLTLLATTDTLIIRVIEALYNQRPGYTYLSSSRAFVAENSIDGFANALAANFASSTDAELAAIVTGNLGLTGDLRSAGNAYFEAQFRVNPTARGKVILDAMNALATLESDATFGAIAASFNADTVASLTYSSVVANTDVTTSDAAAQVVVGSTLPLNLVNPQVTNADPITEVEAQPTDGINSTSLTALETAVEDFINTGATHAIETWWTSQSGQALDDLASLLNSSSTNPILLGYSGQKVGDTVIEITTDISDIFSALAKGASQTWDLFSGNYNLPTHYDSVATASDGTRFVVNFPAGGSNPDGSAFMGARLTFSGTNLDPTNPDNPNYTISQTQLDILKTSGSYSNIAQSFTVDSNVVVSNQVLQASTLNGFTFTYGNDFIAELTGDVNISTTELTAPASRFEIRVGDNVALDPAAKTDARLYLATLIVTLAH